MKAKTRKQQFVDSHVQGALLRRILMHWCLFFVVTAFLMVAMSALAGDPSASFSARISASFPTLMLFGVVSLALFPVFTLDTIRFSNRFVGPISRLRRSMRDLAENGHTKTLKFRENDFWAEMAAEFNEVAEQVESNKPAKEELTTKA